ncbi:hypothetical protein [Terrabacter sp. 2YAF2]|uniref:hypothetical protein n=1 Tax=Terrabacter sp. 2YAF2 TaxID=3233026 RepID=UPI003F9DD7C6
MRTSRIRALGRHASGSRGRSDRSTGVRLTLAAAAAASLTVAATLSVTAPVASAATVQPAGPALSPSADGTFWGTNGRVVDIVSNGTKAWIAGGFDYVGPTTGRAVTVDSSSGAVAPSSNVVDGTVNASAPDGKGGYYLAGDFSRVSDVRRQGLVHIKSDGSVDRSWPASAVTTTVTVKGVAKAQTGSVKSIAVAADRLIIGGDFDTVNGVRSSRLAAIGLDGNVISTWQASASATVNAVAVVGSKVYVGGSFTSLNGASRAYLSRVQLADGASDPTFAAQTNAPVYALDIQGGATSAQDTVKLGGDFTSVTSAAGTTSRSRLAAVDGGGAVLPWAASANGTVRAIATDPATGTTFVGGTFSQLSGQNRTQVGAYTSAGVLTSFSASLAGCQAPHTLKSTYTLPACAVEVQALQVVGGTVYVGGVFTTSQGSLRHDAASYSVATGQLTPWLPMPGARVRTFTNLGATTVMAGDFVSAGGQYRRGVAKIDLATGTLDPTFRADADNMVVDLDLNADRTKLYLGGTFKAVNGVTRQRIAAVDATTGALDAAFVAKVNKDVYTIAVRQGFVYLGGQFTQIGKVARAHAARISAVDGSVDTTWTANTNGPTGTTYHEGMVLSLAVAPDNSRVFLAGPFKTVNGVALSDGVVALSGATGAVLPKQLGGVRSCGIYHWIVSLKLSDDGQRLYGGDVCPDWIYQWDAVNLSQTKANGLNWSTACNGGMQGTLEVNGTFYYGTHGGDKGNGGYCWQSPTVPTQVAQQRFFAFRASDGALTDYAPAFDSPMGVWSFAAVPQGLLVGGDFTVAGDRNTVAQGLTLFRGTP